MLLRYCEAWCTLSPSFVSDTSPFEREISYVRMQHRNEYLSDDDWSNLRTEIRSAFVVVVCLLKILSKKMMIALRCYWYQVMVTFRVAAPLRQSRVRCDRAHRRYPMHQTTEQNEEVMIHKNTFINGDGVNFEAVSVASVFASRQRPNNVAKCSNAQKRFKRCTKTNQTVFVSYISSPLDDNRKPRATWSNET